MDWGSFAYFVVAVVIFLGCVVGYLVLEHLPLAHYYDQELSKRSQAGGAGARGVVNSGGGGVEDEEFGTNTGAEALLPGHGDDGDNLNDSVGGNSASVNGGGGEGARDDPDAASASTAMNPSGEPGLEAATDLRVLFTTVQVVAGGWGGGEGGYR